MSEVIVDGSRRLKMRLGLITVDDERGMGLIKGTSRRR